jgi:hypothetical protein
MDIVKAFEKAFERKKERGWKHIYVFVDIHDTIFLSDYGKEKNFEYYKYSKRTLQLLSNKPDVILGLYTSSHPKDIIEYLKDGIYFQLNGDNPMEKNSDYACFDKKPYFNVLLDDKAGFEPEKDWEDLWCYLIENTLFDK